MKENISDISTTNGTPYSVTFVNNSPATWYAYLYQKMPSNPAEAVPLAWQVSPYAVASGLTSKFTWTIDYSFTWSTTDTLSPGVVYTAAETTPCDPAGNNQITFDLLNNAPQFSALNDGGPNGNLIINVGPHVPYGKFSAGIGMSGSPSVALPAIANVNQVYTPEPEYWIAVVTEVQVGQVLAEEVSQTAQLLFPVGVYNLTASLDSSQNWSVS
ncbi:TPA: protein RhiA [Enterobacter mori]|uniref:protein RhiA n=1 Tax=Enterobacter mori TaxID=539813 RepID=UPI002DB94FBF|nr:protein RhiA [Enterobacter mori]MEB7566673.1 protein RhiA [Enterobacter mori]